MVRVTTCWNCKVTAPCWGHPYPGCIACLDAVSRVGYPATNASPPPPAWVLALRADRADGLTYAELADRYGVAVKSAWLAATGRTYRGAA